jgi:thiol-disulfide isomerase/thioredoxin
MARILLCLSAPVLFTLGLMGCRPAAAPVAISNQPVSINNVRQPGVPPKPIEQMSWVTMDGTDQKMKELKGKVVILDFWATYCEPCKREIPHLNSLQAQYGADQLQVVGLNVGGDEDRPKIPAFLTDMKVAYPVAFPEDALVSYIFGDETAIPQTAVFDRSGKLVIKIIGFDERIRRELDAAVAQAARN